jgi:hypothetical protein
MVESAVEFQEWAKSKQVGCMFARAMFRAPAEYGLTIQTHFESDPSMLAHTLHREVERCIEDAACEGYVPILPGIQEPTALAALLRGLESCGWELSCTTAEWGGQRYALITAYFPVGQDGGVPVLAESVVFAPFGYLPPTRRSPVTAMTIRTKPELSGDPLPGRTERRGNLAAIKMDIPANTFTKLWAKSQSLRRELDGVDNPLARARVTSAFIEDVWTQG